MSVTSGNDLDWFLKYIEVLPSDAKLHPPNSDNQSISLTVDDIKKISVENFNKCISKLNSPINSQQENQDHHQDNQEHQQDNQEHQQDNQEHQPDNQEHQPDNQEHQPDNQEHQPDNQEHQPDNREHQPDNQEHQPDNQEHQPDNQEHQPDNQEHQPDNQEYQPDNQEQQPDNQIHQPDNQERLLKELRKQIKAHPASNLSCTPFDHNSWQKVPNCGDQEGIYHYNCLNTAALDIIVEIPSSLYALLTEAMQATNNKTEMSCKQIATHRIKCTIKTKKAAGDTSVSQVTNELAELKLNPNDVDANITDVNALLALIIVLKCYPKDWKSLFFWDAWLAITIQLFVLGNPQNTNEVFPTLWMDWQGVFFAESQVSPEKVKCLLLGQDPVPKHFPVPGMRKATGIAFHNIGNNNPSVFNMDKHYKLDCSDDKPITHCSRGILIVNMIRCIFKDSNSMSQNIFRIAWTLYTLKLAHHFSQQEKVSKIIVFCLSPYQPDLAYKYLPKVVSSQKFMHVHHPSRVRKHPGDQDVIIVAEYLKGLQEQYDEEEHPPTLATAEHI